MLIRAGKSFGPKTVDDIEQLTKKARFIILSSIKSETITNVYDLVFNVFSNKNSFIDNNSNKTKVSVINVSESNGSIHDRSERLRSVFFHTGTCEEHIDAINMDSTIAFNHVDYNVLPTKVGDTDLSLDNSMILSYNSEQYPLKRYNSRHLSDIVVPTPNYYEEIDMVKMTGDDSYNFHNQCSDLEYLSIAGEVDAWNKNVFRISLRELMDNHTKVMKIDYNIEHNEYISQYDYPSDEVYYETACSIKLKMETYGFSSMNVILSKTGFNVLDFKTYMNMEPIEAKLNLHMLYGELQDIHNNMADMLHQHNVEVYIHSRNDKVNVKIFDDQARFKLNNNVDRKIVQTDLLSDTMSKSITDMYFTNMYS